MSEAGWLTVKEASVALGVNRAAVYLLVASGKLGCYRVGPNRGRLKFRQADIDAYLESVHVGPKAAKPEPDRVPYVPKYDITKRGSPRLG